MHAGQGEEYVLLHPDQPPPPQIVQVEVTLQPREDAFDALPPPQPLIQLRSTLFWELQAGDKILVTVTKVKRETKHEKE